MTDVDLVIVDLDDTLWKWCLTWHAGYMAFNKSLHALTDVDPHEAWVHMYARHAGRVIEMPPDPVDLTAAMGIPLHKSITHHEYVVPLARKERDNALELFDGVVDTLMELKLRGVPVVAHTDAPYVAAGNRIHLAGLDGMISTVYAAPLHHPFGDAADFATITDMRYVADWKPKPDHTIIDGIVKRHGTTNARTLYVGDSLRRDMSMAQAAGLIPVWARYGNEYDGRDSAIAALIDVHRLRPRPETDYEAAPEVSKFATVDSFCEILDLI